MTESDGGSSIVRRWQLAAALKDLRERAGLTQDQAVERLHGGGGKWSTSKLSRVENREHGIRPREVEQLLDLYGVSDPVEREQLLTLAARARERDWRYTYGPDLSMPLRTVVSLEADVIAIRQFEIMVVPGLLQTTDYTRALIEATSPVTLSPIEVDRRVALRMTRQHILRKERPPTIHVILDEGVLRRVVGNRSIMRDQLRKLVDLASEPPLTLQVLPFGRGAGPGFNGPFTLLTLPEPTPDVLYGESGPSGMVFIEDQERVRTYTLWHGMLTQLALSRGESLEMLGEMATSFE
ncbi:helix-turn-helix domain-containing protein [Pseudonocardia acaciae]|uniref:helix-turn-helix domain-containing protein n=1 Tax=Pseudonocardia acaciae TaxID=551276 RepID=UPI00048F7F1C|nr:helix-turn-helix transcriptional regulator [Pseudonocardia acaciae]